VPCLARSWSVDPTGTTWIFALRTDVYFHSDPCFGLEQTRRLTAEDVRYSIERICNARTKTTGLWVFRTRIEGADVYHEASKTDSMVRLRGLEVLNDSTIRIKLTSPFAPFLALLTIPYAWIVPREAVETYGANFGRHPVGTGPFVCTSWQADVALTLTRWSRYFKVDSAGRRLPYLRSVRVTFLRDRRNEFLEFTRGEYDMVSSIDGALSPALFEADGSLRKPFNRFQMFRAAAHSVEYYGMLLDTTTPVGRTSPLSHSPDLRRALNYAIDRHRLVTYVMRGRAIPATHGVLPPSMGGFSDTVMGYTYNPTKARQLLAKAGFPHGKGLPPLLLQLGNSDVSASVAEAVQSMWKEIGVSVELRQVDFPQHLSMVRSGDLAMWRTSWIGDYPDPENFLALFVTENRAPKGPNTTHITSSVLDSLYAVSLDPRRSFTERSALYHRMEQHIIDEAPWVFLYHDVLLRLVQPSVRGYRLDGSDRLVLERVSKNSPSVHH
jgi:ABC-type transport system substrate-binding protein